MNHSRYLAIMAAMIFGLAGWAFAQQADWAQRETRGPATQPKDAQLVACACSHMDSGVMACNRAAAPDVAKEKHASRTKDKGASTIWDKGDPTAPQNRIEYGGGG